MGDGCLSANSRLLRTEEAAAECPRDQCILGQGYNHLSRGQAATHPHPHTFVARAANLHKLLHLHLDLLGCWLCRGFLGLLGSSPSPTNRKHRCPSTSRQGQEPSCQNPLALELTDRMRAQPWSIPTSLPDCPCSLAISSAVGLSLPPHQATPSEGSQVSLMFLPLGVSQVAPLQREKRHITKGGEGRTGRATLNSVQHGSLQGMHNVCGYTEETCMILSLPP